ncbi:MAG: alpha/beta hydrolase [Oscillospiraceae bacterium]|nr:alpha/beta hydrolase [Oscillospiraceae bacterium]
MTKPTILILHGWGCDKAVYAGLTAHLSATHTVILPELPGFGETPEPPDAWGVSDYADCVAELGVNPDVLLAHSLGCRIALKLLSDGRLNPRKIIFTGAAGIKPKRTLSQRVRTRVFKLKKLITPKLSPEKAEALRQKYGSADYRAASPLMRQCLVKIVNEDLTNLLAKVPQDTLLIWGENDDSTPLSDGQLMEKLLPNAGLAVMKNAGHYAFLEQPALFLKIIDSYLGDVK